MLYATVAAPAETAIDRQFVFKPTRITVRAGTTVVWETTTISRNPSSSAGASARRRSTTDDRFSSRHDGRNVRLLQSSSAHEGSVVVA